MSSILEIRNLSTEYYIHGRTVEILKDVSLTLEKGKSLAVVGESGSGKTTLGYCILRLIMPWEGRIKSGEILFNSQGRAGTDLLKMSDDDIRKIRGKKISAIFQNPGSALNPVMKISAQMEEMLPEYDTATNAKQKILETLEKVQLPTRIYDAYPHQISGGQKQRVAIAMSIINEPEIIIADEPTTGLDATIAREIIDLLISLKDRYHMSFMLITHDLRLALNFCDDTAVMYAGEIFEKNDSKSIINNPLHPYTKGLMAALPDAADVKKELTPLPGIPPNLEELPEGCYFAPRCAYKMDICEKAHPKIYRENGSEVRCFLCIKTSDK